MKKYFTIYSVLIFLLIIVSILGIMIGSTDISIKSIFKSLLSIFDSSLKDTNSIVILNLRIPRTILAICVGGSLSLSGVLMQSVFKNPMAEPYIIGVSSGASLGAVIAMALGLSTHFILAAPIFAFISAFFVTLLVYRLSIKNGVSNTSTILLSGIAISSFLGAVINFILYSVMEEWQASREILFWLMGSFEGKTFIHAVIILPVTIIMFFITLKYRRVLDILSLGEMHATTLGVSVEKSKREIILIASILTSVAVSLTGMIGFVGLIIPHIARIIVGPSHKRLVPVSFLIGAIFLCLVDLFIRISSPYFTLRLGIVTGIIGSPFFLYLLINKKRKMFGDL